MHRTPSILLAVVLLAALASPLSSGCHLIFRYEDRPMDASPPDARLDGKPPLPDAPRPDAPRPDAPRPDTRRPDAGPPKCVAGNPCDDGQACTKNDTCVAGICMGVAYSCSDNLSCTVGVCDGKGGCTFQVASTHCKSSDGKSCLLKGSSRTDCMLCEGGGKWTKKYPCVSIYAGSAKGFADGTLANAKFDYPQGISVDSKGDIYVADMNNHRLRKISGGMVSTYAGSAMSGYKNDQDTKAQFKFPEDIDVHGSYAVGMVADTMNNKIRVIRNGAVQTMPQNTTGAEFVITAPAGVAMPQGTFGATYTVYFTAKTEHRVYRAVCDKNGITGCIVSKFAGTGTSGFLNTGNLSATFKWPKGIAVNLAGELYVADYGNHVIRKIGPTQVTTAAGINTPGYVDDATTKARFQDPEDVVVDSAGIVYVADSGNHAIRKIDKGQVTTVAGGIGQGKVDGLKSNAKFYYPTGIAIQGTKTLYVADRNNHVIRKIELEP